MSIRIATALELPAAALGEYARRHDEIWDAVRDSIRDSGGRNMSIFALPECDRVVMYVEVSSLEAWAASGATELTRAWWRYMAEIMPSNPDGSPLSTAMPELFHQD